MAIVAVFEFPNESIDKYEKVMELGGSAVLDQPARLSHVCYRTDNGFAVVDVWTDEQSFGAFGTMLMEYTRKAGLEARPTIYPLQNMVYQDGTRLSEKRAA
jgi:hypothetical protein